MPADNTRDLVIELRAVVERLEKAVQAMEVELTEIREARSREGGQRAVLMWLGGAVIADAATATTASRSARTRLSPGRRGFR